MFAALPPWFSCLWPPWSGSPAKWLSLKILGKAWNPHSMWWITNLPFKTWHFKTGSQNMALRWNARTSALPWSRLCCWAAQCLSDEGATREGNKAMVQRSPKHQLETAPLTYIQIQIQIQIQIKKYRYRYIDTDLPSYIPTYIPTYTHTCMHAYMHTCIHTYIHYIPACIPTD